jgi:hypothetical protein
MSICRTTISRSRRKNSTHCVRLDLLNILTRTKCPVSESQSECYCPEFHVGFSVKVVVKHERRKNANSSTTSFSFFDSREEPCRDEPAACHQGGAVRSTKDVGQLLTTSSLRGRTISLQREIVAGKQHITLIFFGSKKERRRRALQYNIVHSTSSLRPPP